MFVELKELVIFKVKFSVRSKPILRLPKLKSLSFYLESDQNSLEPLLVLEAPSLMSPSGANYYIWFSSSSGKV